MSENQPARRNGAPSSSDFVPLDAPDAFDARHSPIVAAAVANPASASCYPLLGPRREPEVLLPESHPAVDDPLINNDLVE